MNSEILRIIDKQAGEVLGGLSVDGVVFCVSKDTQRDEAVQHRGENRGETVASLAKDIAKRPFILVGFTAFVLLTPLALTSFNRAVKALGAKRWQALHKTVYAIAGLAILHFFWMRAAKNNFAEVAVYAVDPGDMATNLHRQAVPDEDLSGLPAPESVVPALVHLLSARPPSGRYRAADLLQAAGTVPVAGVRP